MQRLKDLLAMGRVANLPTVVSNVLVGVLIALAFSFETTNFKVLLLSAAIGCSLYLGGCFLNDWKDATWDARQKPERPIPSGRWNPRAILAIACTFLIAALMGSAVIGTPPLVVTIAIIASIAVYTWLHKRTAWSVLPMGLCRALLYPLGFFSQRTLNPSPGIEAFPSPHDSYYIIDLVGFSVSLPTSPYVVAGVFLGLPMIGLIGYIAGLSLLARFEASGKLPRTNKVLALCLLSLPFLTHTFFSLLAKPLPTLVTTLLAFVTVVLATYLIKKSISAGVSLLLANIALLDLIIIAPHAILRSADAQFAPIWAPYYWGFAAAALAAFFLALLLQRFAPAT